MNDWGGVGSGESIITPLMIVVVAAAIIAATCHPASCVLYARRVRL